MNKQISLINFQGDDDYLNIVNYGAHDNNTDNNHTTRNKN